MRNSVYSRLKLLFRFQCVKICGGIWLTREYMRFPLFAVCDLVLSLLHCIKSPYRACRVFWGHVFHKSDSRTLERVYGETPLFTWSKICRLAGVSSKDCIMDLGAGKGRLLLWSNCCLGCRGIAIELVPSFVRSLLRVIDWFSLNSLEILAVDIFSAPFDRATVIYYYGSLDDEEIMLDLAIWLASLPSFPLIITVGFSLKDYLPNYSTEHVIEGEFGWGKTDIYFQRYHANEALL